MWKKPTSRASHTTEEHAMPDRPVCRYPLDRRTFFAAAGAFGILVSGPRFLFGDERDIENGSLHFHTRSPNNAEPSLPDLVQTWITPVEKFYIRSHGPNPEIKNDAEFTVSVEGLV